MRSKRRLDWGIGVAAWMTVVLQNFEVHIFAEGRTGTTTRPISVVVWDEQQPSQREVYPEFIGNHLAEYLETIDGLTVRTAGLADAGKGISGDVLDSCDVLVWWGHLRNNEISPAEGRGVVRRITEGHLGLVALHSAHWSTPFMEAMNERTRAVMDARYPPGADAILEIDFRPPPERYMIPDRSWRITPYAVSRKFPGGRTEVTVQLPLCCFPSFSAGPRTSLVRVVKMEHPVMAGVPFEFTLNATEMYCEPFHVPEPDEVLFEERWSTGEWFRSGCVWRIGRGRVVYLRPGDERFPVYREPAMLRIIGNAILWLGADVQSARTDAVPKPISISTPIPEPASGRAGAADSPVERDPVFGNTEAPTAR